MRIGILTLFGNNFGAVLQCYALQNILLTEGHSVEIISYIPYKNSFCKTVIRKLKSVESPRQITELFTSLFKKKDYDNNLFLYNDEYSNCFEEFRKKYLTMSIPLAYNDIGVYANRHYDAIYVGSDQVWTDLYAEKLTYFVDWQPEYKGIRISYAACSAHNKVIHRKQKERLKDLLLKFNTITVRDNTTSLLVENILGIKPIIIPDPTERYEFKEFLIDSTLNDSYILTYILGNEIKGGFGDVLSRIKKRVGDIPVYSFSITTKSNVAKWSDKIYYSSTPQEWLNLIKNARVLLTDSYHGVLFSLKFRTPCVAYYRNYIRSTRLLDLKERRGFANIIQKSSEVDGLLLSE